MNTRRANGRREANETRPSRRTRFFVVGIVLLLLVGLAVAGSFSSTILREKKSLVSAAVQIPPKTPKNLDALLSLTPAELETVDNARMNLLCAEDLPGAEYLNVDECLATLDQWAQHAKTEIDRNHHHFVEDPAYYYNSEAFYKMLMLAVVVYEDFGVRYNPKWIAAPGTEQPDDHFFADSRDILIHGLVGTQRMGTCSSMPVFYIALGRRLGYPLKLVKAKGHLFMRWDSPTEKFDMDATGKGLNRYDDEFYKTWPFPLTEADIQEEDYLKSLSPREELSVFLSIRGACQTDNGQLGDALASFNLAYRYVPTWKGNQVLLAQARHRLSRPVVLAQQQMNPNIPADPNPMQQIRPRNPFQTP